MNKDVFLSKLEEAKNEYIENFCWPYKSEHIENFYIFAKNRIWQQ